MITPNPLYPGAKVAWSRLLRGAGDAPCPLPWRRCAPWASSPVVYPSCYYENRHGYFAADDAQRPGTSSPPLPTTPSPGYWPSGRLRRPPPPPPAGPGCHCPHAQAFLRLQRRHRPPYRFQPVLRLRHLPHSMPSTEYLSARGRLHRGLPPPRPLRPGGGAPMENPEGMAHDRASERLRRRAPLRREPLPAVRLPGHPLGD